MPAKPKPRRLWDVPAYLPYLQPPLTSTMIAEAEAALGVTLPPAYLDVLRTQNGGYVCRRTHPRGDAPVDVIAGIGPRFPSILRHDWANVKSYMEAEGITKPARIDELFAFCGDGHFYYCLDYRASGPRGEPRVTYIDVESFHTDKVVAPNFGTFLDQLTADEGPDLVGLCTDADIKTVATAIARVSGYALDDQGSDWYGYTVYRGQLPGQHNWVFLTPNRVRRGFVRKDERDYSRLRRLMPGEDDRFPHHSDCAYFVECDFDSAAGRALLRKLETLPFAARRLRLAKA